MKIIIPKRVKISGKNSKTEPQTKWDTPSHSPPKQLKGFYSGDSAGAPTMDLLLLILHLALTSLELGGGGRETRLVGTKSCCQKGISELFWGEI